MGVTAYFFKQMDKNRPHAKKLYKTVMSFVHLAKVHVKNVACKKDDPPAMCQIQDTAAMTGQSTFDPTSTTSGALRDSTFDMVQRPEITGIDCPQASFDNVAELEEFNFATWERS
jgi:hypothetical protein